MTPAEPDETAVPLVSSVMSLRGFCARACRPIRRPRAATVLLVGLLGLGVPPVDAELAVFVDGRVLHVTDARLQGARIVLDLPGGGRLEVPAVRIDRVIAGTLEPMPGPAPAPPASCSTAWRDEPLPEGMPYAEMIRTAARAADLHPRLLAEVVRAESAFDPWAVSRAGAAGLTQLMPAAARDHGVVDRFDPAENLRGGAAHLRALLDRFDSLSLALAAYNAGAATVERYGGVPPFVETRAYLDRLVRRFCPGES